MKKVLAVLLVLFCWVNVSFSATTGPTPVCTDVWENGKEMTCVYSDTSNPVVAGVPEVFKILTTEVLGFRGKISEVTWESSSTSWSVFLSRIDSQTTPSSSTFLKWSETSDTLGSPEIGNPRTYYNGDGYSSAYSYLYFTVSPVTVDTGDWTLTITFVRY